MKNDFIKKEIIDKFSSLEKPPLKLIELCKSININYSKKSYLGVIIFSRAILDYIPSIFGHKHTSQIYSSLNTGKTFKNALRIMDTSTRLLADDILHVQASLNEIVKVDQMSCDSTRGNMLIILDGVMNQLGSTDLRPDFSSRSEQVFSEPKSQLQLFEKYLKNKSLWIKEFINNNEVWIYSKDNLYQIHSLDNHSDFSEPWTQTWPDAKGSGKYSVDLRFNDTTIKQFTLIYFDGGRESIVMPKMETSSKTNFWENKDLFRAPYKNVAFYINKESIEYSLSELVGSDIERVCKRSHIEIR